MMSTKFGCLTVRAQKNSSRVVQNTAWLGELLWRSFQQNSCTVAPALSGQSLPNSILSILIILNFAIFSVPSNNSCKKYLFFDGTLPSDIFIFDSTVPPYNFLTASRVTQVVAIRNMYWYVLVHIKIASFGCMFWSGFNDVFWKPVSSCAPTPWEAVS